jgi:hypothetical protein
MIEQTVANLLNICSCRYHLVPIVRHPVWQNEDVRVTRTKLMLVANIINQMQKVYYRTNK